MSIKRILALIFIWQVFVVSVTWISPQFLTLRNSFLSVDTRTYLSQPLLYSRANFDGFHYLTIASRGYGYAQQAFFPLYPQLIKTVTRFILPPELAAVTISLAAFTIGLVVFARLLALDYSQSVVYWAVVSLLVFPSSWFFGFAYTEGLFFALVVGSFYAARRQSWLLAGVLGGLAAYTRLAGIFLLPALFAEWYFYARSGFTRSRQLVSLVCLAFIPLGLGLYMHFLYRTTGDPFAFMTVQSQFGQGRDTDIILLYQVIWRYVKMVFTVNRADPLYLTIWFEFLVSLVSITLSFLALWKSRFSYALFGLLNALVPTLTGVFTSMPRYVLLSFPVFILIGRWLGRQSRPKQFVFVLLLLAIQAIFLLHFVRGYWVA